MDELLTPRQRRRADEVDVLLPIRLRRNIELLCSGAIDEAVRRIYENRARLVVELHDVVGLSLPEVGRRLGISRQMAHRIYARERDGG